MNGLSAVLWKELREIQNEFLRGRGRLQFLSSVLAGGMLGLMGAGRVDMLEWAIPFVAAMSTVMVVVDAFAGERERHTLETLLASRLSETSILLGKYLAVCLYAVGTGVLALVAFLMTLLLRHREAFLPPSGGTLGIALGASVLAAGLIGAFGLVISIRAQGVRQTQQVLAFGLMIPAIALVVAWGSLSPATRDHLIALVSSLGTWGAALAGVGLVLLAIAVLLGVARARFKRSLLILD